MEINGTLSLHEADFLLSERGKFAKDTTLLESLHQIEGDVRNTGDDALLHYTKKFDGVELTSLFATPEEINNAQIDEELESAITIAYNNIHKFHKSQYDYLQNQSKIETTDGVFCWRKFTPIEKVGLYVPAGSAPLFSTVLMTAIPAQIAGCKDITLATPPQKDGTIHPAILFTAKLCGIKNILKVGGAQAIFALAYGTKSIPKVYKIFGPGNKFVDGAKQMVQNTVAIDMPAGPSEVMIVCDDKSCTKAVASDALSQLEHDPTSSAIVICNAQKTIEEVNREIIARITKAPRHLIIERSIKNYYTIIADNLNNAIPLINEYAPEHLILNMQEYQRFAENIVNAGSVFLGKYSAESIGDYASGTNHTLPTSGFAKSFSGLSVEAFGKFVTFQEVSYDGFQNISNAVQIMSEQEGLFEHANAIAIRR